MKDVTYIFSVNPDSIMINSGQFGNMTANGAGKQLFGKTRIEGRTLLKDLGDDNYQPFVVTARSIAEDIVERYAEDGLFLTDDNGDPAPQKIAEERSRFRERCHVECRHADSLWSRTHNRELIGERARRAARFLNLTPEWADPIAEEMKECPYCAERIKARAKFCKECKRELEPLEAETKQPKR